MIYRFDHFQVDDADFRLTTNGTQIPLEPRPFCLLLYFVQNSNRLVRKQEIFDTVWQEAAVTDAALTRSIGLLRKALGDDSRAPRFIETVPTEGYRFIAVVSVLEPPPPAAVPVLASASIPETQPVFEGNPQPAVARLHLRAAALAGALLLLVAVAGALIEKRLHTERSIRSLAVLPLDNLSGDPSQEYFAEGMTDELTTELARIPNLRVVSRTSMMLDKNAKKSLPEIARELGVDAIVEGSIVRSGDRIRITAQLIDGSTDRHLWAQSFEGPAKDVLSLQDSVAQQIASQARLVLLPSAPRPPVDPATHDAYLRGRYFLNKQDISHSMEYFQQAISLDPNYASAYSGYATALDSASAFGLGSPEDLMPKALAAARRAIQLDPQNSEAYTALGSVQTIYRWDWTAAEQNLTRGISLNPNDSISEFKYAVYLDAIDRPQDAVTHMRRALQLDPLSFLVNRRLGATLYLARQYDAALAQLQRAAEMEHQPGSIDNYVSLIYEQKGQHDQAIQYDLIALHGYQPQADTAALLAVYQKHGWQAYWLARNKVLLIAPAQSCTPYEMGVDDLRAGDLDQGFQSFQHALDRHCFYMALIRVDPLFDSVRHDSRYTALLARMHP